MEKFLFAGLVLSLFLTANMAGQEETIKLPEAKKSGGMSLLEALNNRQSQRSFSSREISQQELSNLLWAAYGINREDGRRTAPSARNVQEFDIYLIMAKGWYKYDHEKHALMKMGSEDLRKYAGTQDYVATAPVNLIFVADHDRMTNYNQDDRVFYSAIDVGFISQNVYLFCASEGLATVVRGLVDREKLREVLNLRPSQHVILGQTVGYPE